MLSGVLQNVPWEMPLFVNRRRLKELLALENGFLCQWGVWLGGAVPFWSHGM